MVQHEKALALTTFCKNRATPPPPYLYETGAPDYS
jgi:hypothetical protein